MKGEKPNVGLALTGEIEDVDIKLVNKKNKKSAFPGGFLFNNLVVQFSSLQCKA